MCEKTARFFCSNKKAKKKIKRKTKRKEKKKSHDLKNNVKTSLSMHERGSVEELTRNFIFKLHRLVDNDRKNILTTDLIRAVSKTKDDKKSSDEDF